MHRFLKGFSATEPLNAHTYTHEHSCTCVLTAKIIHTEDGEQAINEYKDKKPDLVFMDIVMPKKTGIEALREIRAFDSDARVVMASTVGTQGNLIAAIKEGAFEFLQKPVKEEDVLKIINRMLKE